MLSEQADAVYQRFRELVLENPKHGFHLPLCRDCRMDHGRVVGEGDLQPTPLIAVPFAAKPNTFKLTCQLCSGIVEEVTEEVVLEWMDVIGSILMFNDLSTRGVYAQEPEG